LRKDIEFTSKKRTEKIIVLLIGGDKSTQQKDIAKAKEIWGKLNK